MKYTGLTLLTKAITLAANIDGGRGAKQAVEDHRRQGIEVNEHRELLTIEKG